MILPRKLLWGNNQHGDSSNVTTAMPVLPPPQQDPALQGGPPHPHLLSIPSHQQEGPGQPACVQCVFDPKPHLINGVELELNFPSRVKYRFSLLAGDKRWLFTV